jgi:GNAT superfamily N-acetyltransferase
MSSSLSSDSQAPTQSWLVRRATSEDVAGVVIAIQELLLELGAAPPPAGALREVVHELLEDRDAGAILVARMGNEVVGVLGASWQLAMHVPGRYALIQDLWVHPAWRSRTIGADLIAALVELARERGIARIEVGLPRERFSGSEATAHFYRGQGFQTLGPRMRREL